MAGLGSKLLRTIGGGGGGDKTIDPKARVKLVTLRELPKSLYATNLAVTTYPHSSRGRKAVFNHIEVYKMVESVANKLRESGVRPGTVCAMALPNTFEAVVYFFALQWIGAIAAPLDPSLDSEGLKNALQAVKAQTLMTPYLQASDAKSDPLSLAAESACEEIDVLNWKIYRTINEGVLLEMGGKLMGSAAWAGGAGDFKLDPEEIAVHALTDGDAIRLSHRALAASARAFATTYKLEMNMNTVLINTLNHVQAILVLVASFYSGGHIILSGSDTLDAALFWEHASKHNVNWVSGTSDEVLDIFEAYSKLSGKTPSLDFVRCCGGKLAPDVQAKVSESLGAPVLVSYGSVECAGLATSNTHDSVTVGTAGQPVDGVEVRVFDSKTRELLPMTSTKEGEIGVSGEAVTSGFLVSEEATQMATYESEEPAMPGAKPDDAAVKKKKKWFATGDRGAFDADGNLVVVGDSRELRAAELAALQEQRRLREAQENSANEERQRVSSRSAILTSAGIDNADGLDEETAEMILARLSAIEANQAKLETELADKHQSELEDLRNRLLEAEEAADRAARGDTLSNMSGFTTSNMLDVRMDEMEAAVKAAAASAEVSAANTKMAVKAAKDVAASAYGANQSRDVAIASSTGDQGALTKTVRVALDDVESAMRSHPAVMNARAFGRKDKRYGAEVFCAIVPKKGARVSEPWLKLHAQSILPAPMVPKKFFYIHEVPMGMSRRELSESKLLQDLSAFAGFSDVKHVRGPAWNAAQANSAAMPRIYR